METYKTLVAPLEVAMDTRVQGFYLNPYIFVGVTTGLEREIEQNLRKLDDKYTAYSTDTNCLYFKVGDHYYRMEGKLFLKDRIHTNKTGRISYIVTSGGVVVQGLTALYKFGGEICVFMDGGNINKIVFAPHEAAVYTEVYPLDNTIDYYHDIKLLTKEDAEDG